MSGSGRKLKILFAIGRFSVGGAEKLIVHQLRALDDKRFEPHVLTLFSEQKDSCADDVHIDVCLRLTSTLDVRGIWRAYRYLRRGKFDAVVTHLFSANLIVRIAAVLARVPVVISYEHNVYPNKRRWQIAVDRGLSRWTDLIITDSEAARTFTAAQESIPLDKFKTFYIPPLVEKREPRPAAEIRAELGIPGDARIVLTVSRLVDDKGHTYLVDAAREVLHTFPDAYFLVVGWGPLKDTLQLQVKTLDIDERVRLPGRMDIHDVLPLAEVYVDPAVSTDLPVAIMEAMREGKAIVATDIGEIPVFVEHGKTGLIVPPKDVATLTVAISRLLADSDLRRQYGDAARKKVESFSLESYMREFERVVEMYVDRAQN